MTRHQKHILDTFNKQGKYEEICSEKDLPEPPPNFYWLRKKNVFQSFFNQWTPQWTLQRGEWRKSWLGKIF